MRNDTDGCCRVCGYAPADPPWGVDGSTPSFEICPCCGVEFGYEDATPGGVRRYRELWLSTGGRWSDDSAPGDGLATAVRLQRVADEFR